jgi:hypothetical protein
MGGRDSQSGVSGGAPLTITVVPGGIISTRPLVSPEDLDEMVKQVANYARAAGGKISHEIRVAFYKAAIDIGKLPPGFPRDLLHAYVFGNYATVTLTPAEFIAKVDPIASVFEPNKAVNGSNNFFNQLQSDLASKTAGASTSTPAKFWAKYLIGAFHGAHNTGGLGRMALSVDANVTAWSRTDWELQGTAILRPEKWDFDWEWSSLATELWNGGVSIDRKDLKGRERRTALGSSIPGQRFYVAMSAPVRISQSAGEQWATFFV